MLMPVTRDDEQHRALARGAVQAAADALTDPNAGDFDASLYLTTDVVEEVQLAWLATGLLPNNDVLSGRDIREVCEAVARRVAAVLVMVGWQPPARLLPDPVSGVDARDRHEEETQS